MSITQRSLVKRRIKLEKDLAQNLSRKSSNGERILFIAASKFQEIFYTSETSKDQSLKTGYFFS